MKDLIEHFTTEELKEELIKRDKVRTLQLRIVHMQDLLDELVNDAFVLGEIITLINKRAETLTIKQDGGYNV